MIKFCRSCGQELAAADDKICKSCGANAVKATRNCRYCGYSTAVEDATCPRCGAAIKPLPRSVRSLFEYPRLSVKIGRIINLSLVAVLVTLYMVFSLPKSVTKPISQAASDTIMASTGYTTFPLDHISATPPRIPQLVTVMFDPQPSVVSVNTTRQLTVYAIYKNADTGNATKGVRLEDITTNSAYRSSNGKVATVNATGFVRATGSGEANIIIFYTVAPGSANLSNAAGGKVPVTFNTTVPVFVR